MLKQILMLKRAAPQTDLAFCWCERKIAHCEAYISARVVQTDTHDPLDTGPAQLPWGVTCV